MEKQLIRTTSKIFSHNTAKITDVFTQSQLDSLPLIIPIQERTPQFYEPPKNTPLYEVAPLEASSVQIYFLLIRASKINDKNIWMRMKR